jgi:hypothetical protein
VVETYALLLASLLLLYGALNDLYGCQMVFVSGVLLLQLDRPGARFLLRSSPSFRPWPARHRRGIPRARKSGYH